jgi:MYXO-CTERM domain-containing protein
MSRPLLALLALAALVLLPAATAQVPAAGGSLAISGLPGTVMSNQTQAVVPFTVQINLNQGTCVGGSGQFQVALTASKTGGNASVEVQPATLTFQVPQTQTLAGAYASSGGAVLVVKPGLVRENVTVPVTVKATATVACTLAAGMGATLATEGSSTLKFVPVSEEVRNGPSEVMPGPGLPLVLAVLGLALALRRR